MNEKINELFQDEAFVMELLQKETDVEVQALLKEHEVELSLEDIATVKKTIDARINGEGEELSDDDLENVAGGSAAAVAAVIGIVSGIVSLAQKVNEWTNRRW